MTRSILERRSLEDRFAERVDLEPTETGCLLWTGCKVRQGYGRISIGDKKGKTLRANRVAWFIHHGEWPDGMVMHSCDVPECVNIEHLSVGTAKENTQDAIQKGRFDQRGVKHHKAKLTEQQVLDVRQQHAAGELGYRKLAQVYDVSWVAIGQIVRREHWRHI